MLATFVCYFTTFGRTALVIVTCECTIKIRHYQLFKLNKRLLQPEGERIISKTRCSIKLEDVSTSLTMASAPYSFACLITGVDQYISITCPDLNVLLLQL